MAALPAVAFHFRDGHAFDADVVQRILHLLKLVRLDDAFQQFHDFPLPSEV
jgi:hypothetical protein